MSEFDYKALHGSDRGKLLDAIEVLEERSASEVKKVLDAEKDKRREDWATTTKWALTVAIGLFAVVAVLIGNLMIQLHAFNRELRDVRDRVTENRIRLQYEDVEIETSNEPVK